MSLTVAISLEESQQFAELSGDRNPLHVDPVLARRSLVGGTVCHGMHVVLKILDGLLATRAGTWDLTALDVTFHRPLPQDQVAVGHVRDEVAPDGCWRGRIDLRIGLQSLQTISVTISRREPTQASPPPAATAVGQVCHERSWSEVEQAAGSAELAFEPALATRLFPHVASQLSSWTLAELLATTRVIGMECPGRHSLFTRLQLRGLPESRSSGRLEWRVAKAHRSFSLLGIALSGPTLSGEAQAIVQPPPAIQDSYAEVQGQVRAGEFAQQSALIVGGSRGLGEVAAKILAAGGASVVITHRSGVADAERVMHEIQAGGGRCRRWEYDVLGPPQTLPAEIAADVGLTHLYFFASPPIGLQKTTHWDPERFQWFCQFYVRGALDTVRHVRRAWQPVDGRLVFFYPSTVLLDVPDALAAEYAAAKAAGEQLCRYLPFEWPGLTCCFPRLPRLLSDQTNSFAAAPAPRALPVLLEQFRQVPSAS